MITYQKILQKEEVVQMLPKYRKALKRSENSKVQTFRQEERPLIKNGLEVSLPPKRTPIDKKLVQVDLITAIH